jgi:hypothetical protein
MQSGYYSEKKRGHAGTVVLSVLAVLLAAAGVVSWMALNDPNAGKGLEKTPPSEALALKAAKSAITGQEALFEPTEVSGFLNYLLDQEKSRGAALPTDGVAFSAGTDDTADLYLPVTYAGKRLGVTLEGTPSVDSANGRIVFKVKSLHVGRLPVDPAWALGFVKDRLPQEISAEGAELDFPLPDVGVSAGGVSVGLTLKSLRMENGKLGVKTAAKLG